MRDALLALAGPAVLDRLVLLVNHVLSAEPGAAERLQGHAGRQLEIAVAALPPVIGSLLPPPPPVRLAITPAGLLERADDGAAPAAAGTPSLKVSLDGSDPLRWLQALRAGGRPPMEIQGDVGLAADVSWLADHVRWDIGDDLARLVGDLPAQQLARVGEGLKAALQRFLDRRAP